MKGIRILSSQSMSQVRLPTRAVESNTPTVANTAIAILWRRNSPRSRWRLRRTKKAEHAVQ